MVSVIKENPTASKIGRTEMALKLYSLQSPEVQESLDKLRKRYGKYAVPAEQALAMMDKALGERSLTEELYEIRKD